jgi:hypothetical protein
VSGATVDALALRRERHRPTAEAAAGGSEDAAARRRDARRRRSAAARRAAAGTERETSILTSLPDESAGREALERLRSLPPEQQQRLDQLAQDEVNSTQHGSYVGLPPTPEGDQLHREGRTTRVRRRTGTDSQLLTLLSDEGRQPARVLSGEGELSDCPRLQRLRAHARPRRPVGRSRSSVHGCARRRRWGWAGNGPKPGPAAVGRDRALTGDANGSRGLD